MSEVVQWVVAANEGAVRLDTFLATRLQPQTTTDASHGCLSLERCMFSRRG